MGKGQALDFKKEKSSLKHYTLKNQKYSRFIGVKTMTALHALQYLSKKCRAKHLLNDNNPSMGLTNRLEKLERGTKN